jgi:group I intron endonuclease
VPLQVYRITNKLNGNFYIGQTGQQLEVRFGQHCRSKNNCVISRAIRKYGKENFSALLLGEYHTQTDADHAEMYFIEFYNSKVPNGYNTSEGGNVRPAGWKHAEETKKRIGLAGMGRKASEKQIESMRRVGKANRGKTGSRLGSKASEETKKKLSLAHIGKTSNRKGIRCTEEQKALISERTKIGMRNAGYGIK